MTRDAMVHDAVRAAAVRSPDSIAVIARDATLTHAALRSRVHAVADALRRVGVGPEARVGVSVPRTSELVVGILGVLEAGGAYVPIDPAWPEERARLVRDDAGLTAIVGPGMTIARGARHAHAAESRRAFCVLYTSGSTGRPKGVVIEHAAIANRLVWGAQAWPFARGEVVGARTPLGFVDSIAELFGPLACGVPVLVLDQDRDPIAMLAALAAANATRVTMVPSMLATLIAVVPELGARVPSLRWWFVGGEPIPPSVVAAFRRAAPGRKLVNLYGATEVSGDGTAYDFDHHLPDGLVQAPIGVAIGGCTARILDEALREVPDGQAGEVVIGGVCVARGYLGQPARTAERFVDRDGERVYRTGDRGRRMPSGDLQYLGRLDTQVKIRGARVELGEVEAAMVAVPGVTTAIACAREVRPGERTLVGWYEGALSPAELRAALAARVPLHVIPDRLIATETLPRNPSGKLDRRALEAWPLDAGGAQPRDDRERALAAILEDALGVAPIGRDRSFHDLGGTSLVAVRIAVAIREQLGAPVALAAIYAHPTIAALAAHVATLGGAARTRPLVIAGTPLPAELPLTDQQAPFWWFRALTGDVSVVTEVLAVTPAVEPARLADAVADAARGIDALWMAMPRWRPVQRPRPRGRAAMEVRDLRAQPGAELQPEIDAVASAPFDLDAPPHLRARLVWLPGGDQRLIVVVPHVIADMSAMELLRAAIERALAGTPAPRPGADLRDLVTWQRGLAPDADDAWLRAPSWTRLPARLFTGRGRRGWSRAVIAAELEAGLIAASRRRGVSLPITLIAAIHAAVTRLGATDPRMLLMIEHRDRPELAGLFTTLASMMPCHVRSSDDLDALVRDVARAILEGRERADTIMRRPRWLLRAYLGALASWPRGDRRVLVCVNVMPEVTRPTPASPGPIALTACRELPHLLRPDDLVVGKDALLARTLQLHVTRAPELAVNLYGGGLGPEALDELAAHIAACATMLA